MKDKGIVLKKFPYKNGFILEVFMLENGKNSFIVFSRKNKNIPIQAVQSLDIIQADYVWNTKTDLQKFNSFSIENYSLTTFVDPIKNCIQLFFAEFLKKILLANSPNPELYHFFEKVVQYLQVSDTNKIANLPSFVLMEVAEIIGVLPDFNSLITNHNHKLQLDNSTKEFLYSLKKGSIFDAENRKVSQKTRSEAIEFLNLYYQIQIEHFTELKSLAIVKQILD